MSFERHTVSGLALLAVLAGVSPAIAQSAPVQFIHASPYAEARTVDVYINGALTVDDLEYGSATPFMPLLGSDFVTIDVTRADAPDNSTPLYSCLSGEVNPHADPWPASGRCRLFPDIRYYTGEEQRQRAARERTQDAYLMILVGDPLNRSGQPAFDLFFRSGAQGMSLAPPFTETIFFVATPGSTKVDISVQDLGGTRTVIPNLGFGDFSQRIEVAPVINAVSITTSEGGQLYSFVQDYRDKGSRLVVNVVSGFDMDDTFTVLPDGETVINPVNWAYVQFIHNSPYAAVNPVDVYVNDLLKIDNLGFREATPFIELPSGLSGESAPSLKIDVTRGTDADNSTPLYSQETRFIFDQNYVSVLAGNPNLSEGNPAFELFTYTDGRRRAAVDGFVDVLLFHSSSHLPALTMTLGGASDHPLVEHLDFGTFESYRPVPTSDMTLLVTATGSRQLLAQFDVPLFSMGLEDSALVVLTSGMLASSDTVNRGESDFGLVAALPSGGSLVSFEATMPLPWWKSPWSFALALVGLVAILIGGTQVRIYRLRARERTLGALVSERTKDLEAEKRKTEDQAERLLELDSAKNRFLANISHEFRTPITLILGPLQDLLDGVHGKISRRAQAQIRMMHGNAGRLLHFITELLDLSRMDAGQLEVHIREVDLIARLEALVRSFIPLAEHKRIELEFKHDPEKVRFGADPDMLDKVFGNLLSNALKFTPEGGKVWLAVRVPENDEPSHVEVLVKDTGPGISRENLVRIFDRFASFAPESGESASTCQAHEGIGIGLALAKELVELQMGVILVESEPGFGSTFIVRLPLLPVSENIAGPVAEETETEMLVGGVTPGTSGVPALGVTPESLDSEKPMILIVEDNTEVREYLRLHLGADYRIVDAANGQEGLKLAKEEGPDLVLADVMMPVMDGYELCRALKADSELRNVPVVILTAKAGEADTLEGLEIGADDYIAKPFGMPEVKARIANLIHARRQMRRQFSREIVVQPAGIAVDSDDEIFVDRVLEIINAHLGDTRFGVDWLADEMGMSGRNLRRRLESVTGEAPAELIRRLRLQRGADLLKAHAGTVAEVAYRVGFKSHSHFSAAFRRTFGVSPSEHVGKETADDLARDLNDSR